MDNKKVYSAVKALIEKNGKFLVIEQEIKGKKYIDLPGGKVDFGESPFDTLIREVKEEVFLDIEIIKPVGLWWFFRAVDGDQVVCSTFLCKTKEANVDLTKNPVNENITNYYWLDKKELLERDLPHESLKKLIESI